MKNALLIHRQRQISHYQTLLIEIESLRANTLNSFSNAEQYTREKDFFETLEASIFQHANETALLNFIQATK